MTVIVPQGAFVKAGQIEVSLTSIRSTRDARLTGAGVTIFGNAYRFGATYQPSGDQASSSCRSTRC